MKQNIKMAEVQLTMGGHLLSMSMVLGLIPRTTKRERSLQPMGWSSLPNKHLSDEHNYKAIATEGTLDWTQG